jgi:hypothetical protein
MYWYKSKVLLTFTIGCALLFIAALPSCKPEIKETGAQLKYFDLEGYFNKDSVRLNHQNPLISKTVSHNKVSESKKVHIANWGNELALFKGSDINKPAWRDSYRAQNSGDTVIYQATDPDLKTREIMIKQVKGKVKWIFIYNHTKNLLYETSEELSYFPDSLYTINKKQTVLLIGTNYYNIKGLFN